ncbi:MAG: fatty acid desaturase [Myxococcales bacterium]|nr:MAG: fatty acid desaturase [Myxococcales bacterium]
MRTGNELIQASKSFAQENRLQSWLHVGITLLVLAMCVAVTAVPLWWPVRALFSVLFGLTVVRMFCLYHDFLHNAILKRSAIAKWLVMYPFGLYVLTPPNVWKQTHNYHHAHTAKIVGSHVGSYPMVTTEMWKQMTLGQRVMYRIARHPLNIAFGYITIFLFGMCVSSFVRNPRKNWDSLLALVLHGMLSAAIIYYGGWALWFFTLLLPLVVAFAAGGYLFYAQHNFEGVHVQPRHEWNYTDAALHSSSYLKSGPIMRWFTANIGYHHVHHLNPTIPFYRLPEVMAAMPELQHPKTTSFAIKDMAKCFSLKLWDPEKQRMVGYGEA